MKCTDFEILLQLAADGEILETERSALEAHLDDCVACRRKEAWLELLDEQFAVALSPSIQDSSAIADAVVDALAPLPMQTLADVETPTSRKKQKNRAQPRKKRLFMRVVSSLWSRRKRKQAKAKVIQEKESSSWLDASVSALQPAPTSLEGFRAARQGVSSAVSGPVQALKLVAGGMPPKGRS